MKNRNKPKITDFIAMNEINIEGANFEMDIIQDQLLQGVLRESLEFRKAFSTDFTPYFFKWLDDKHRLKEPRDLCAIGNTRSGKSESMISIGGYNKALNFEKLKEYNICSDEFDYMNQLKKVKPNDCFVVDESKLAVYNIGSTARRMKLQDLSNIIAVNCISTIMIRPDEWASDFAHYGLKTFGRCFKTKTNRFLMYNLQETTKTGMYKPLGLVYIPIFTEFLTYGKELKKIYDKKKQDWVNQEQYGERDVLFKLRLERSIEISNNSKYRSIKKKKERHIYTVALLGSEYTKAEAEQISTIADMLIEGTITEQDLLKTESNKM